MLAYMEPDCQAPEPSSDAASRIERALGRLRRPRPGAPSGGGQRFRDPGGPFPGGPAGTGGFGHIPFPFSGDRAVAGGPFPWGGSGADRGRRQPGPPWHRDDAGPGGPARIRLLEALEGGPRTITELAEAIGVDQPRASRLVAFGVRGGMLHKGQDPADARRAVVELTEAGRAALAGARDRRRDALQRGLAGFTPEEAEAFAALLERFVDGWTASPD